LIERYIAKVCESETTGVNQTRKGKSPQFRTWRSLCFLYWPRVSTKLEKSGDDLLLVFVFLQEDHSWGFHLQSSVFFRPSVAACCLLVKKRKSEERNHHMSSRVSFLIQTLPTCFTVPGHVTLNETWCCVVHWGLRVAENRELELKAFYSQASACLSHFLTNHFTWNWSSVCNKTLLG
jgi:hypothetical protein